jgi:histidyl-tRNA synthetase
MANKPSIPKGTRDFSPEVLAKRNYIFDTIKDVFKKFAYKQLETPAMENLATLTGKYGDEGDKLLFKILNSGDFLKKVSNDELQQRNIVKLINKVSEKGLRYDLTVPFARYVVQHKNEITFPFKRFQIQPVWRADRPQKGRFREFYQCDADVVGSTSLIQEVEFVQLYDEVFANLGLKNVAIKINNRKILAGVAEVANISDLLIDMTVALDKLDKIGEEKVKEEMLTKGISEDAISKIQPLFELNGTNGEQLDKLAVLLSESEVGIRGVEELRKVISTVEVLGLKVAELELNVTLARGLNYYTGAIYEIEAKGVKMGSIGGGGRYDDLTGIFGLKGLSGVGISFGLDRIYLVLEELGLFPDSKNEGVQVMFVNFGEDEALYCLKAIRQLRENGINAEIYPDSAKMKKQMNYANKKEIPFVALVGEQEMDADEITIKNMESGEQTKVAFSDLGKFSF